MVNLPVITVDDREAMVYPTLHKYISKYNRAYIHKALDCLQSFETWQWFGACILLRIQTTSLCKSLTWQDAVWTVLIYLPCVLY